MIIAQPIGAEMRSTRYASKTAYVTALRELHLRAKRSGWNIDGASRTNLAYWLKVNISTMNALNLEHGITLDDIRAGRV